MAFVTPERTRETTSTTGTSTVVVCEGTISPNQRTFTDAVGIGNNTFYEIVSGDGEGWEIGIGSVTSTDHFSRDTVIKNSEGDTSRISLAGQSHIFTTFPGNMGLVFTKVFGGDFEHNVLEYDIASGEFKSSLGNKSWKQSVAIATTAPLAANTYSNGTAGVGATLTATGNGLLVIDGVDAVEFFRVLVKNETNPLHNGIYEVTAIGDGSHPYILTRTPDYDDQTDIHQADIVSVAAAGGVNGRTVWLMDTSDDTIDIGSTTDINWSLISAPPALIFDAAFGNTRGNIPVRGASAWGHISVGASNSILKGGTDPSYDTLSNILDDVFGNTRGQMLRRGASGWQKFDKGTSGQVLTMGANDPDWADNAGGGGPVAPTQSNTGLTSASNLGSATVSDISTGILISAGSNGNASNMRFIHKSMSAPFTVTARVALTSSFIFTEHTIVGIGFYDGSAKLEGIGLHIGGVSSGGSQGVLSTLNYSAFGTASNTDLSGPHPNPMWLRVINDGTAVHWAMSMDGEAFRNFKSTTISGGFLTSYTDVFFGIDPYGSSALGVLMDWEES